MKSKFLIPVIFLTSHAVMADDVDEMFNQYKKQGVSHMDEQAGEALWNREFKHKKAAQLRSCTLCHGADLTQAGKHVRTGKAIKPMAPSINPDSLTDVKKTRKWFKRNCKWTLGRECSAQEQADILIFLNKQ